MTEEYWLFVLMKECGGRCVTGPIRPEGTGGGLWDLQTV